MVAISDDIQDALPFGFEERLQELVATSPDLLSSADWTGTRLLLGREIPARGQLKIEEGPASERTAQDRRGWMDVCFVEADGVPTIVEAKLASNATMKDVLTQAFGYAEALFANPGKAVLAMRRTLGGLAECFPASPSALTHSHAAAWP